MLTDRACVLLCCLRLQSPASFLAKKLPLSSPQLSLAMTRGLVDMFSDGRVMQLIAVVEQMPGLRALLQLRWFAPLRDALLDVNVLAKLQLGITDADWTKHLRGRFAPLASHFGFSPIVPLSSVTQRLKQIVASDTSGFYSVLHTAGTGRRLSVAASLTAQLGTPTIRSAIQFGAGGSITLLATVDARNTTKALSQTVAGHRIANIGGACSYLLLALTACCSACVLAARLALPLTSRSVLLGTQASLCPATFLSLTWSTPARTPLATLLATAGWSG